ncbi:protease [Streptomyces cinnamoneus]|uniref:Protease n=1 Tax=Streptomyces cinnamoneus TaxID=53446 RepID=A0A2G1X9V1_STRCJ|nr:alpha/beta hydrolase [Streptomyces cinnamoneus]PHQ48000.1 protease [Streptomyces cinnamoneus]PPT15626.1 alpha/beta hydrolase [Streptomyces cinnamoneus]
MRTAALYGTLGSLILTGLTGLPATPAQAYDGQAETRGVALAARRAADRGIDFGACPAVEGLAAPVQCGTVAVPLDYAHPDGKQIRLTVSRSRALGGGAARQGAIVFNPGGPGGNGMFYPLLARLPAWRNIADAYDLVGYAPRGVGRSAPLSCVSPGFAKGPSKSPEHPSRAYKEQQLTKARAYARGCARRGGHGLRHFTSLNNARDLDVLRAALGQRRLTYVGASYGTYFGALYATLFPRHVRRMVFDSVVNPDPRKIWYGNNLDQSAAFERRWADWRRWVAKHHAVYHLGRSPADVLDSYDKAVRRLSRRAAGGSVGPAQLQALLLKAGYSDSYWARDAQALSAYLRGDDKPLVALAGDGGADSARAAENENAVYTTVECNDTSWPRSWRLWNRDNDRLADRAPFETWNNAFMNLPCAFWQGPHQRPLDVRVNRRSGLPPTLLLAAERDAATPYKGALELQRRLAGSALVTERGAGTHGIGGGPNTCVNRYLETYLLTGEVPARRVYCAPRPEPRATT